ncbi:hypothetical protein GOEFS_096_00060 [Gordonia effusa NBRC 100432]|uniref:Phenazine antibiotic biosynthesis protein n=1 Tax=Gordonia effusa NBRC 100432 TaxID=1077974 RepID=H0R428_9ACTN|nr:hypothetical protein [Gordonia effusa]GAB19829.1 hypothetical protein GOEFS_096_00060 [Gordonia effusa NBRC 100432]
MSTSLGSDWSVLDPMSEPEDKIEYLKVALTWHFGEDTGSPFWLRRAREFDFDPVRDITSYDDLSRFPYVLDELRTVDVRDLIPRGYGPSYPAPRIFESGGTTGAPKRIIFMEDWVQKMLNRQDGAFAGDLSTLSMFPSGPHAAGVLQRIAAEHYGALFFSVDMDPRWVKKLVADGDVEHAQAYVDHILDQAGFILRSQNIERLLTTPPMLRALVKRSDLADLVRATVKSISWGGAHMTVDERFEFEQVHFPGIEFTGFYASSIAVGGTEPRPNVGEDDDTIFDPAEPYMTMRVVDSVTGEPVDYGQRGQVLMHTVTKGVFLPNNLERDTAIRVPGPVGALGDSVSAVKPVEQFDGQKVIEGIY